MNQSYQSNPSGYLAFANMKFELIKMGEKKPPVEFHIPTLQSLLPDYTSWIDKYIPISTRVKK